MKFCYGIFLIIYGLILYILYFRQIRDMFNPIGVTILIWCFSGGISSFQLSYLQTPWTFVTYLVVFTFPTAVAFSGVLIGIKKYKRKYINNKIECPNTYLYVSRLLYVFCFICSIIEWKQQNYSILLLLSEGSDAKTLFSAIPGVHYGTILLPYCSILAVFELCFIKTKKRTKLLLWLILIWSIFYSLFITVSRGTLLIIVLASLFIISRKHTISLKSLLLIISGILAGFIAIAKMRIWSGSMVFEVIPDHPLLSSVYSYVGINFENLNKLIKNGSDYSLVIQSFRGVWELLGFKTFIGLKNSEMTEFFNATTICYDFYEDLGLIGVGIFSILIFSVIQYIYNKSITDSRYVLLLASLQKAIWMCFFSNYFTSYRSVIIPYIVILLLIFSFRLKVLRLSI